MNMARPINRTIVIILRKRAVSLLNIFKQILLIMTKYQVKCIRSSIKSLGVLVNEMFLSVRNIMYIRSSIQSLVVQVNDMFLSLTSTSSQVHFFI